LPAFSRYQHFNIDRTLNPNRFWFVAALWIAAISWFLYASIAEFILDGTAKIDLIRFVQFQSAIPDGC